MTSLNLRNSSQISKDSFLMLINLYGSQLKKLTVDSSLLGKEAFEAIGKNCHALEQLIIGGQVDANIFPIVDCITKIGKNLKSLCIKFRHLRSNELNAIATNLPNLERLRFDNHAGPYILLPEFEMDTGIAALLKHSPKLKSLGLHVPSMNNRICFALLEAPNLKTVDLTGTLVTDAGIQMLKEKGLNVLISGFEENITAYSTAAAAIEK